MWDAAVEIQGGERQLGVEGMEERVYKESEKSVMKDFKAWFLVTEYDDPQERKNSQ
jgi:hypothetical protein